MILPVMINNDNLNWKSILVCGGLSTARGILVTSLTQPLEVIKTQLQDAEQPRKISDIAKTIYREQGLKGYYRGLAPKITQIIIKDWWRWPSIIYLPGYLEKNYSLSPLHAQIATGLIVSNVDTLITAPLERYRIKTITGTLSPDKKTLFQKVFHGGWKGLAPYWCRATVGWVTYSIAQRFVRDNYKNNTHKTKLDPSDYAIIGFTVAITMSLTLAPFDLANTRGQSRDISMKQLWNTARKMPITSVLRLFWRGVPLQALISSINHITLMVLIDKHLMEFD